LSKWLLSKNLNSIPASEDFSPHNFTETRKMVIGWMDRIMKENPIKNSWGDLVERI